MSATCSIADACSITIVFYPKPAAEDMDDRLSWMACSEGHPSSNSASVGAGDERRGARGRGAVRRRVGNAVAVHNARAGPDSTARCMSCRRMYIACTVGKDISLRC
jgi:hypothetical protein